MRQRRAMPPRPPTTAGGEAGENVSPTSVHERPNTTQNRAVPDTREEDESTTCRTRGNLQNPTPGQIRAAPPNHLKEICYRLFVGGASNRSQMD